LPSRFQWTCWSRMRLALRLWLNPPRTGRLLQTGSRAGALTVAGQWRILTAFPNILAF